MELIQAIIGDQQDRILFLNGQEIIHSDDVQIFNEDVESILYKLEKALSIEAKSYDVEIDTDEGWNIEQIKSILIENKAMTNYSLLVPQLLKDEVIDISETEEKNISEKFTIDVQKTSGNEIFASVYPLALTDEAGISPKGLHCIIGIVNGNPRISIGLDMNENMIHVIGKNDLEMLVIDEKNGRKAFIEEYNWAGSKEIAVNYSEKLHSGELIEYKEELLNSRMLVAKKAVIEKFGNSEEFQNHGEWKEDGNSLVNKSIMVNNEQHAIKIEFKENSSIGLSISNI